MRSDIDKQAPAQPAEKHLLINRNFTLLWLGQSLSGLGDVIFEITLTVWIGSELAAGKSWAALAVTALLVASAVPVLVVGPIAGALVDRQPDKRRLLLRAEIISALLILVMIPAAGIVELPLVGDYELPLTARLIAIFTIVFLASAVAQFLRPASSVVLRDIVPDADRPRAAGLSQASFNLSLLVGPTLAAPLLFAFGAGWALLINSASFIVSFFFVRAIHVPDIPIAAEELEPTSARAVLRDIGEGLRFFRNSHVLMTLAIAFTTCMLGLGAVNALDLFFVIHNLDTPAKSYGILASASGAGMIIGAIAWGFLAGRLGLARSVWMGLIGIGIAMMIYARTTSFIPGVIATFVIGLIVPAVNVAVGPIMFRVTPRALIGRVSSTLNPLMNGAMLLGLLAGGLLYSTVMSDFSVTIFGIHFGPLDTIFLGTGLMCVLGGLYATTLRIPAEEVDDTLDSIATS
jgi:MFS family permease